MSLDIKIYLTDREGKRHELVAPTDMQMNLMEIFLNILLRIEENQVLIHLHG